MKTTLTPFFATGMLAVALTLSPYSSVAQDTTQETTQDATQDTTQDTTQDIVVSIDEWDGLSAEEQEEIQTILTQTQLLPEGAEIRGEAEGPSALDEISEILGEDVSLDTLQEDDPQFIRGLLPKSVCRAVCDTLAAAAAAACTGLSGGVAISVCLGSANFGREQCRRRC